LAQKIEHRIDTELRQLLVEGTRVRSARQPDEREATALLEVGRSSKLQPLFVLGLEIVLRDIEVIEECLQRGGFPLENLNLSGTGNACLRQRDADNRVVSIFAGGMRSAQFRRRSKSDVMAPRRPCNFRKTVQHPQAKSFGGFAHYASQPDTRSRCLQQHRQDL
jgi:hypothetical protein